MMLSGVDIQAAVTRYKRVEELRLKRAAPEEAGNVGVFYERERELERLQKMPLVKIDPFSKSRINPNSYNLRLASDLRVYDTGPTGLGPLDAKKDNPTIKSLIPKDGYVLLPGVLYLACTMEFTESWNCVPAIAGRSSTGRLGLSIHETAGFGDVGFCGTWTLELVVTHPVVVYPGMEVAQICYHTVSEEHENYKGRYLNQVAPTASRLFQGDGDEDRTDE